jgi:hypothetical protein
MVAITKILPQQVDQPQKSEDRIGSLAKLKVLHSEAEETARLANLLGRSLYAGIALPVLAILTIGLAVDMRPDPQLVWCLFVAGVAGAMLMAYRHAMRAPFERAALKDYAKDLSAILLFAGFAWGSGAFLALPAGTTSIPAILFVAVPSIVIAYLLRDREALLLFLAPATVLTVIASLLKPFEGGIVLAALLVAVSGTIVGALLLYARARGVASRPAMLSLP